MSQSRRFIVSFVHRATHSLFTQRAAHLFQKRNMLTRTCLWFICNLLPICRHLSRYDPFLDTFTLLYSAVISFVLPLLIFHRRRVSLDCLLVVIGKYSIWCMTLALSLVCWMLCSMTAYITMNVVCIDCCYNLVMAMSVCVLLRFKSLEQARGPLANQSASLWRAELSKIDSKCNHHLLVSSLVYSLHAGCHTFQWWIFADKEMNFKTHSYLFTQLYTDDSFNNAICR